MNIRTFSIYLLIVAQIGFTYARGPAVEDFVGIEIDHPEGTPQGTEGLFNFEKDIKEFKETDQKANNSRTSKPALNPSTEQAGFSPWAALALLLGMPALVYLMMMNHLKKKAYTESATNIGVLEKFRRQKEEAKKNQEDIKKAS